MNFKYKYTKYKKKYLELKKQIGGMEHDADYAVAIARSKQSNKKEQEIKRLLAQTTLDVKPPAKKEQETIETIQYKINNWNNEENKDKMKILLIGVTKPEIYYNEDKYLIIFFDNILDPNSKLNWLKPENFNIFTEQNIQFDIILLDYGVHSGKLYENIMYKRRKFENLTFDNTWQNITDGVYIQLNNILKSYGLLLLPKNKKIEITQEMNDKEFLYRWAFDYNKNVPQGNKIMQSLFIQTDKTEDDPINSNNIEKDYPIQRYESRHKQKEWLIYIKL